MKKLIVLENDSWFWKGFDEFIKTISPEGYERFAPQVSDSWYLNHTALWLSMTLSQKEVTDIAMQSAFETQGMIYTEDDFKVESQIGILLPVIREVLRFREQMNYPALTFHVVYNGTDFMKDMKDGDFGETAFQDFELIMRQQSNIIVKLYDHETFKLKTAIVSPIDL